MIFERKELRSVGRPCGQAGVIERKQQCVDVGHPAEARRRYTGAHFDAVGQHGFDAGLLQHPRGVVGLLTLLHAGSRRLQIGHGFCIERAFPLETPERPPRRGELRIVGAPCDRVGLWGHVVDRKCVEVAVGGIGRRGEDGVRVVVEGRGGVYESTQLGIDVAGNGVVLGMCKNDREKG